MVWLGMLGFRASAGICNLRPCPCQTRVRGVPGTTSSVVVAIMSAPRMGTEGRKGGKEGGKEGGKSPPIPGQTSLDYHNATTCTLII